MKLEEIRKTIRDVDILEKFSDQAQLERMLQSVGIEPRDFYQELEMSRLVDIHPETSYSNTSVSLHSHIFYELLYCRSTCGVEFLVESARYQLKKGDIILLPPGISHQPLLPEHMPEPYRRDVLWVSDKFLTLLRQFSPDAFPETGIRMLRTAGTRWEYLGDLFQAGVREFENQEPGWEVAILSNTANLLVHLSRALTDKSTAPLKAEKPELLEHVMVYVEHHLAERITLAEVAKHFYVSESTISKTFCKKMGGSFYRYVTQRRLIAAKVLIEQNVSLESVAEQVGFTDYSAFFRAFKKEYGIGPRQYRKQLE